MERGELRGEWFYGRVGLWEGRLMEGWVDGKVV